MRKHDPSFKMTSIYSIEVLAHQVNLDYNTEGGFVDTYPVFNGYLSRENPVTSAEKK